MQVTTTINWLAVNWPANTPATQYAVLPWDVIGTSPQLVSTNSAAITYEDQLVTVYTIRPTDGTNYGPAQSIVVGNGTSTTRAWIRQHVRKRVQDRVDQSTSVTVKFTDDTINDYIAKAVRDYSLRFGQEQQITITCIEGGFAAGARDYQLPANVISVTAVRYSNANQLLQLELTRMPFKGGESTAGTLLGYPKLGLLVPPSTGRFYGGHYDLYENILSLDFDPIGNGDTLRVRMKVALLDPTDDITPLPIPIDDLELLTLATEIQIWEQLEGADVSLSRWRSKDDGSRRDDLPTEKMSARIRKTLDAKIQERLSVRTKVRRLVRRG